MEIDATFLEKDIKNYIVIKDSIITTTKYNDSINCYNLKSEINYWIVFVEKDSCLYVAVSTSINNLLFNKLDGISYYDVIKKLKYDERESKCFEKLRIKNDQYFIGNVQVRKSQRSYFTNNNLSRKTYMKDELYCYIVNDTLKKRLCFNEDILEIFKQYLAHKNLEILTYNTQTTISVCVPYTYKIIKEIVDCFGEIQHKKKIDLPLIDLEKDVVDQLCVESKYIDIKNEIPKTNYILFENVYIENLGYIVLMQFYKKYKNVVQVLDILTDQYFIKSLNEYENKIYIDFERR